MHVHPCTHTRSKVDRCLHLRLRGRSRFVQSDIPWESVGNVSLPMCRSAIAGFAHESTANSATLNPVDRSVGNLYRFSVYLACELTPPPPGRENTTENEIQRFCVQIRDRFTVTEYQISAIIFRYRLVALYSGCLARN